MTGGVRQGWVKTHLTGMPPGKVGFNPPHRAEGARAGWVKTHLTGRIVRWVSTHRFFEKVCP